MTQEQKEEVATFPSVQDCIVMVNVLDLCAKRGAIKASEFEMVGRVRGSFIDYIQAVAPESVVEGEEIESED